MIEPLKCAHCGETKSREGFVALTEPASLPNPGWTRNVLHPAGAVLRIECARGFGAIIPETTGYLIKATF